MHLTVKTHNVCYFVIGIPHSGIYFLVPTISLRISWKHRVCFYRLAVLHFVNIPNFLYPFFCWRISGFIPAFAIRYKATMNIVENVTLLHVEKSFEYIPRRAIGGSSGSSIISFLKSSQSDFQSVCTDLQSHQHCRSVPLSPHPCLHLLSLEFFYLSHSNCCEV